MAAEKKPSSPSKKNKTTRHRKLRILLTIVGVVIVIRLILPYIVLHYANKSLASMHGYYGHISDIDLDIYRGAYTIKDIYLNKLDSVTSDQTQFFDSRIIDLSVEWKSLFHGRIVGELALEDPSLRFTKDKAEPAQIQKDTNDFRKILKDFMPLQINRFEITHGRIHYIDSTSTPSVNIQMDETHILAQNLKSIKDTSDLPSSVIASANVYDGTLSFNMKLNALADDPTFDLNSDLKNTNLPKLNDFFKAYGKFDVHKGTFGMYTEIAAKDGKFTGYVKPVINDLDIVGPEDRHDNILQKMWEVTVGAAGVILRNQKKDQIATKIPLEGTFKNSSADIWYAIFDMLRNAFIQALQPSIDYEINIHSVYAPPKEEKKGFFKKVFGKDDKKKKEADKTEHKKDKKKK
jgi:hypothetical protein